LVIRIEAIESSYAGGLDAFDANLQNATACSDGELVRVGFMAPADVEAFARDLEAKGLTYLRNGAAQDLVVIDQQSGPLVPCDWIEAGRVSLDAAGERRITIAWLIGGDAADGFATPPGWDYATSLSRSYSFVRGQMPGPGLRFLRRDEGLDVYWDELAGKEVFLARKHGAPG